MKFTFYISNTVPDNKNLPYIYERLTKLEIALVLGTALNVVTMGVDTLIKQSYELNKLEYKRNIV